MMELHLKEKTTYREVQEEFSLAYPFLKMDLVKPVKDRLGWTIRMENIQTEEILHPYYQNTGVHVVNIDSGKTLTLLKKEMEEILFLKVIVLRKSGNVWIETSLTKDWTLEQQNREGKYLSV
jgi:hypothetical protein